MRVNVTLAVNQNHRYDTREIKISVVTTYVLILWTKIFFRECL